MEFLEENQEGFSKEVIRRYLKIRLLSDMGKLNKVESYYLSIMNSYFNNALNGLKSVISNPSQDWINEDASWFYEALTGERIIGKKFQKRKMLDIIQQVEEERKRLEFLANDPIKSYEKGNSAKLADFIDKLWGVTPYEEAL